MVSDLLRPSHVQLAVPARDWRDAVRRSFAPFRAAGEVSQGYVDDVIAGVEEQGPYIVVTPHVAIPHARPACGAYGKAIGVTTLDRPVAFGSADNDPVRYLLPLSVPTSAGHLEVLSSLVELLSHPSFLAALDEAESAHDVVDAVRDMERSH